MKQIWVFILHFLFIAPQVLARRKYEYGIHPVNFCPRSKLCPSEDYVLRSSKFQVKKNCDSVRDCNTYEICCHDHCSRGRYCTEPVTWIDDHVGECSRVTDKRCQGGIVMLRTRCRHDTDCFLDAKCCFDPCLRSKVCFQITDNNKNTHATTVREFFGNTSMTTNNFTLKTGPIVNWATPDHQDRPIMESKAPSDEESKLLDRPYVKKTSKKYHVRENKKPYLKRTRMTHFNKDQSLGDKNNRNTTRSNFHNDKHMYDDPIMNPRLHQAINLGGIYPHNPFFATKHKKLINIPAKSKSQTVCNSANTIMESEGIIYFVLYLIFIEFL